MATELETGLPSVRLMQSMIREGAEVEVKLLTGDSLTGKMRWQDPQCIALSDASEQLTIIWRQAIAFIKSR